MRTLSILALVLLAVAFIVPVYAQSQAPAAAPTAPATTLIIIGVIEDVKPAENLIVVSDGVKRTTLIVEKTTVITLADGKAGRLDELKKDEKVEVQDKGGVAVSIKVLPAVLAPVVPAPAPVVPAPAPVVPAPAPVVPAPAPVK